MIRTRSPGEPKTQRKSKTRPRRQCSALRLGSASAVSTTRDFPSPASHSNIAQRPPRPPLQYPYRSPRPSLARGQTCQDATAEEQPGSYPSATRLANAPVITKTRGWPRASATRREFFFSSFFWLLLFLSSSSFFRPAVE